MAFLRRTAVIALSVLVVATGSVVAETAKSSKSAPTQRSAPTAPPAIAPPKITVTSPAPGGSWKAGSSQTVTWSFSGDVGPSVSILLQKGSVTLYTITSSIPPDKGTFNWTVPKDAFAGTDYRVAVVSNGNPSLTGVSGIFSLTGGAAGSKATGALGEMKTAPQKNAKLVGSIIVKQPAGGEEWQPGTSHMIAWDNIGSDKSGNVNIVLLKGDSVYKPIAVNVPLSSGKYNWLIPANTPQVTSNSHPTEQYRVQIVKTTDEAQGTSDFFFILKPGIVLADFPHPEEFFVNPPVGAFQIPVKWTHAGTKGTNVTITLVPGALWGPPTPFYAAVDIPIGLDGKGKYDIQYVPGLKEHILKYAQGTAQDGQTGWDWKGFSWQVKIAVVGTGYSATSKDITLKVVIPKTGGGVDAKVGPLPPK